MLKLASIAVNRVMPMPEGLKETTKFTVVAMYISKKVGGDGIEEDVDSTMYAYRHCDNWEEVIAYVAANPIGTPLTTVH